MLLEFCVLQMSVLSSNNICKFIDKRCICQILGLYFLATSQYCVHVDAAYCYRRSSVVCLSICHSRERFKNGWNDRYAVWVVDVGAPKEPCVRWGVHIGATWRIRLNRPCAAAKTLCQITLTTCSLLQATGEQIPLIVRSCIRIINMYGECYIITVELLLLLSFIPLMMNYFCGSLCFQSNSTIIGRFVILLTAVHKMKYSYFILFLTW